MAIIDEYIKSAPSPQNALDIFKGQWTSRLPGEFAALEAGQALLFEDGRVEWVLAQLGGVRGCTVLELGPLEAGHTYLLQKGGAASITAVEANARAYLKCLIVKELLQLTQARFLCGDFVEYLRASKDRVDLCLASGVLYHMRNPAELIALIAGVTDRVYLWTHYYDQQILAKSPAGHKFPHLSRKILPSRRNAYCCIAAEHQGFRHTLYRQEYKQALAWGGFCGGGESFSYWMSREDILGCLRHFGLSDLRINYEDPHHPRGPSFCVLALRPR